MVHEDTTATVRSKLTWPAKPTLTAQGTVQYEPIDRLKIGTLLEPRWTDGQAKRGIYNNLNIQAMTEHDPHYSTHHWTSSKVTGKARKVAFKMDNSLIWHMKKAHERGAKYFNFPATSPLCPLCRSTEDGTSHIFGECTHPCMKGLKAHHISRHNKAVQIIQKTMMAGPLGGWYTIMDATTREDLPEDCAGQRLPGWMVPDLPTATTDMFRPDTRHTYPSSP